VYRCNGNVLTCLLAGSLPTDSKDTCGPDLSMFIGHAYMHDCIKLVGLDNRASMILASFPGPLMPLGAYTKNKRLIRGCGQEYV
jgi:hypothetical protein